MKVAVTGSRTWTNRVLLYAVLDSLSIHKIVVGDARGADSLATLWAQQDGKHVGIERYVADWQEYGKAAGMLRNRAMLDEGKPELLVAFRHGRTSRGTDGCVKEARARSLPVLTVEIPQ